MSKLVRSIDGDTISDITWRELSLDDDETEDKVYDLNPHLHDLIGVEATLPAGVEILLPDIVVKKPAKAVNIWD
ncbi:tail protein X [Vibrio europaeus]|uniref:tail protein X n=1 Tax=Vibrio europaeus TaxID=300876 RepID=UPI00233F48A8|nr:tail protein X [Vibrio europaeus]MDC5718251.1 tail protein X [Vibrio europaeus]